MGFFYLPHGAIMTNTRYGAEMNRWTPDKEGRDFDLKPILEPFAQQRKYMTVVSGLGNRAAESPAVHAIHPGTWLTRRAAAALADAELGRVGGSNGGARVIGQDTPLPSARARHRGAQAAARAATRHRL